MHLPSKVVAATAAASFWLQLAAAQATCSNVTADKTYDYIIVGSGAGGMPLADRLSEAGKTVLLIEKGPPSTGRWGGIMKPGWLNGTRLTRFDVPGLCNQIWADPTGVSCTDVDQMAGCVLGGGTAVNAGLWWKPHPEDWDVNFPTGWQSKDLVEATNKVFGRIPGTIAPSQDGVRYLSQGFDMLGGSLRNAGWEYVVANNAPEKKHRSYGHSTFMFSGGERGGPLATYLASAASRSTFTLWTNTMAKRVVRTGGMATGVEVECNGAGHAGVVNVTPKTGRVIMAAGSFGSAKLLWRSGIGTTDQLNVIKNSTDGPTMISQDQWINLPVGYNLNDHVGTDIEISHPDVVFYDYYGAWNNPIAEDKEKYLSARIGPLAQAAPNIGPIFWEVIKGADGINRHFHWQSRVEGTLNTSMTVTQYLGTGSTSRGRLTITRQLNTIVSTPPYLRTDNDKAAVVQSLINLQKVLEPVANLTWITPKANVTAEQFIASVPAIPARRGSNHWTGTAKIGSDDGRANGTAVVDLNTKVYGMDNLFVVDASIFPGMITANPSAAITIVSEHAAQKILALPA
ncbi:cellobiose dehydrogenase [Podospora aff. communis PSN243]|uniref:Cellobiose dehydrogenase n=1 Tax=Podospora aff. communis PSN243 TaxID=3040156 RepID=A0AAV9H2U0_9PEZI|nr:cellobiose dehydrogenase [Podospora aff. communis PSN243]